MLSNPHLACAPVWRGDWPVAGRPLVVLVHGRSQTPQYMLDVLARIDGSSTLDAVALSAHENTWYPKSFLAPRSENEPLLSQALKRLEILVEEAGDHNVREDQIYFIGFSQGACLVADFVQRNPRRWGGLACLTGGLIGPPQDWTGDAEALKSTPVLMSNGDTDPWVPLSRTRQTADVFRAMGACVSERVYPKREHLVCADEVAAARTLLNLASN